MVKSLPAMQKTWVRSLGQEDPLEKEMATHSSMEKPMDRGAWQTTVHGSQKVGHNFVTKQQTAAKKPYNQLSKANSYSKKTFALLT